MKKPDRDRESIANAEMFQACALLKLGARALLDLHDRHPRHRSIIKIWVEHHDRSHQAVWSELLGKVRAGDILSPNPTGPDDQATLKLIDGMRRSTAQLEQFVSGMRDIVQTRPDRRDWAARSVHELREWVMEICTAFGQQLVAAKYVEKLDRQGKPMSIGAEPGEPTRPVEPSTPMDPEWEAILALHPEHRIDPIAAAEDFIVKQPDKAATRLRDIAPLYRSGRMDRPWVKHPVAWDVALLEDVLLARMCAVSAATLSHVQWWCKPLRPVIETLDPESLPQAAQALLCRLMDATPMLVTALKHGGWFPTHAGRAIVNDNILPQWRQVTPDPETENS